MKLLFVNLLPLLLTLLVACQRQQPATIATETVPEMETAAPAATETLVATATATEIVAVPTELPTEMAATANVTEEANAPLQTGVALVDKVIAASRSEEPESLGPLIHFITVPCTTAEGLGGPPKCQEGQVEGTPVEVFPVWGPEGHYVEPANLDRFLESLQLGRLYAVYEVADAGTPMADYEPAGEYGVIFGGGESGVPVTLLVDDRGVVRTVFAYGDTPAGVVERADGDLLLGPLQ